MTTAVLTIDVRGLEQVVALLDGVQQIGERLKSGDIDAYHAAEAIDELITEFLDDAEQQDIQGEGQGD
jgi:hypothetical protein